MIRITSGECKNVNRRYGDGYRPGRGSSTGRSVGGGNGSGSGKGDFTKHTRNALGKGYGTGKGYEVGSTSKGSGALLPTSK